MQKTPFSISLTLSTENIYSFFLWSSRLENDLLPLLSVFIDNMHVDEIQIDGGGTVVVITGNIRKLMLVKFQQRYQKWVKTRKC